ncbi:hypothetical protein [Peribacillus muralis]|uniref:hypothetical protein n=1 Tax=Peribacillus muralis TaxID=264697 RepID=UPI000708F919|nr:hypothetical protein [Peribacillus muralis]
MYQKNCHKCRRASFSSAEYGEWLCPTCGDDLTVQKALDPLVMERVNGLHQQNKKSDIYRFIKRSK